MDDWKNKIDLYNYLSKLTGVRDEASVDSSSALSEE